jgi:hypothetical protein
MYVWGCGRGEVYVRFGKRNFVNHDVINRLKERKEFVGSGAVIACQQIVKSFLIQEKERSMEKKDKVDIGYCV